jgi:hypothetical protein
MTGANERLKELASKIKRCSEFFPTAVVRPYDLILDLGVMELCATILDQAQATIALFSMRYRHACFPNIRSGFEASQDLLLLVTSEDPAYAASRFRAAEIIDRSHAVAAATAWDNRADVAAYDRAMSELVVTELQELTYDASAWERFRPGAYDLFMAAVDDLRRDRARRRYHWSGLGRKQIALQLEQKAGFEQSAIWDQMIYTFLSLHTHPVFGGGAQTVDIADSGEVSPRHALDDDPLYDAALDAIIMAASVAADALEGLQPTEGADGG